MDERTKCASLNLLRYYTLLDKTKGKRSVVPRLADFPPNRGHGSLRVFLHVQQWLGNALTPTEWGLRAVAGTLEPIPTTSPPAPHELIKACVLRLHQRRLQEADRLLLSESGSLLLALIPPAEESGATTARTASTTTGKYKVTFQIEFLMLKRMTSQNSFRIFIVLLQTCWH